MSLKTDRIASSLVKEISYILAMEVKNKDINFVTINEVKLTTDLSFAKIYYTVLNESTKDETDKALKSASGFIRKKLADRIKIRHIPELEFIYDESIEYGSKIESIINKINDEKQ